MGTDLDIEQPGALLSYLRGSGRIGEEEDPVVHVLAGGVSNRTVLVERPTGVAWVLKQALEKLRVSVDWFSDPERVHREALGLRWLQELAPPGSITPLVFEDHEHHLLAMEAVPEPHENWKTMLLSGKLHRRHVEQFGALLAEVHRKSYEHRHELAHEFRNRSFFEALRLEPYYEYTARQVPKAANFLRALVSRTRTRQDALTHGDYSPKNILVHKNRLVLLDHEVIHLGDPAFDLGFSLAHLLSKAHHLVALRDSFAQEAETYWSTYRKELGRVGWANNLEISAVHHTLGCLLARVAGRSQLEYLSQEERVRQQSVVLSLMTDTPAGVAGLTGEFTERP
jgi:5-methylthioribose kinase